MIDIDFERLRALGLHPTMAQAVQQLIADFASQTSDFAAQDWQLMRVCTVHRDRLQLHDGLSERSATTLPRLTKQHALDGTSIAVGDWVLTQTPEPDRCWVHAVLPPVTRINRRDADGSRHAVVSNVDTALLVMGLDLDFSLRRLERYLALVQGSGVWPVVVLTKLDTLGDTAWARSERLVDIARQLRERLPPEVIVHALDARSPEVAQDLAPYLGLGQTLVLLGSSGAGKSTLTNSLAGMGLQDTGPVREHDSRGRHTTTARTLLPLLSGACLIDTPGVRSLRPDADAQTLSASFTDIQALAGHCRFRNCQHVNEPGCAVLAQVAGDRVRNFHKLKREMQRDQQTPLDRQRELARWKQIGRAGHERARMKRGE
ncbi:MAG: ribosome small subunit-dependent GTPase A [Burkholderiaceae bacterium]|nr:ribosome small subunit-dependent GTPase A [Burkholderiaceae bacterium]